MFCIYNQKRNNIKERLKFIYLKVGFHLGKKLNLKVNLCIINAMFSGREEIIFGIIMFLFFLSNKMNNTKRI